MYTSKKIKEILKNMIDNGEFEKIINCKQYSGKERRLAKEFYLGIKGQDIEKISIQTLIFTMPRVVMMSVISYLIPYKVVVAKDEQDRSSDK